MKKFVLTSPYKCVVYLFLFITLLYTYFTVQFQSLEKRELSTSVIGTLESFELDGDLWKGIIKGDKKYLFYVTIQTKEEKSYLESNLKPGITLALKGIQSVPKGRVNFHLFSYDTYLKSIGVFYQIDVEHYDMIGRECSIFYQVKSQFHSFVNQYQEPYLQAFLLGDITSLEGEVRDHISNLGIQHLFSISGLHFQTFIACLSFFLRRRPYRKTKIGVVLFLYAMLVGFTPSVERVFYFYILVSIKDYMKLPLTSMELLFLTLSIVLLFNPYRIFHVGFQFSFLITFTIFYYQTWLRSVKYPSLLLPFLIFFVSIPISTYHFFELNFLSPFFNLLFVPLVSIVLFPLSFLAFFFPIFLPAFHVLTQIFELLVTMFGKMTGATFPFAQPSILWIISYYFVFYYVCYQLQVKKYHGLLLLIVIIGCLYHKLKFNPMYEYHMIDVGQGDAMVLVIPHEEMAIMIDTGGKMEYEKEVWKLRKKKYDMAESILVPYLKSIGVHGIDTLILTHGDMDHMGNATSLLKQVRVREVILNKGNLNSLEKSLVALSQKYHIKIKQCSKTKLILLSRTFYFLNSKNEVDENQDSLIIYTKLGGRNILWMGDADDTCETLLLHEYNLPKMDILKVGHHGSKTSSSASFIHEIRPKYALISVGNKNRYGHPSKEALHTFEMYGSSVLRTDQMGGIKIRFNQSYFHIAANRFALAFI